jgi:hypothetical protein
MLFKEGVHLDETHREDQTAHSRRMHFMKNTDTIIQLRR